MTSHRLSLIAAGAVASGFIAFASAMRASQAATWPVLLALLLAAYAIGLGLGRLAFAGRG